MVQTRPGALGQYDVVVDGEVVATRQRSGFRAFLGGGWPTAETVIEAMGSSADAPTG